MVTIQLTTDSPDTCVRKCSLTAVSCAFPPRLKAPTVGSLEQISGNLDSYESIYNYGYLEKPQNFAKLVLFTPSCVE